MRHRSTFTKYSLLFVLILFSSTVIGQRIGEIMGSVKEVNTKENLAGISIQVENGTARTITDADGNYKLSLPVGTYNLVATSVGYLPMNKYNIVVT
ncbi:MAG: carboxypeptidase-like regulatory domain-containing protein, partial [Ginsengibacter sp.]